MGQHYLCVSWTFHEEEEKMVIGAECLVTWFMHLVSSIQWYLQDTDGHYCNCRSFTVFTELYFGSSCITAITCCCSMFISFASTIAWDSFNRFTITVLCWWPPLWSSGQSSWLQIRRPGFDSRHYQKKKVVGSGTGPISLVSTTEELLDRKVVAPV
jgi:hypothetical protein